MPGGELGAEEAVAGMRVTETFFRPEAVARRPWTMPAPLFRLCQQALRRSPGRCAFVPIRSMQFQAVIDAEELIFVDALGDYRIQGGEGGRVILLAWRPRPLAEIESIAKPVPCELIFYRDRLEDVQRRLVGELARALQTLEARERPGREEGGIKVVPLRPDSTL